MTAKHTLTLRINNETDVKALEHLQAILHESTASGAIMAAVRNFANIRERYQVAFQENQDLKKRLSDLATAWEQHQAYKSHFEGKMADLEKSEAI